LQDDGARVQVKSGRDPRKGAETTRPLTSCDVCEGYCKVVELTYRALTQRER